MNDFYNFLLKLLDVIKGDTKAKIGSVLLLAGATLQVNFVIEPNKYTFSIGDGTDIISVLLTIIGVSLHISLYSSTRFTPSLPLF